ncbi:sporulation protein YpjB [Paenibacillus sp. MBLB4367]|uniref:sporulation protein YpjB n=1 Tax=Paenibacillus sp. MBLB4367 TaxID=3384767 RepID=UPI0039082BA8
MFVKGYRKVFILLVLCLLLAVIGGCIRQEQKQKPALAGAEDYRKLEQLNRAADDIYKQVSEGNIVGALDRMNEISLLIPTIHYGGVTTVEGMNALAQSVVQAKRSFNSVYASQQETLLAAAKIRLVADALTHRNEPMWLQYYKVMKEDVRALELAAQQQKAAQLVQAAARYEQHYLTIRPALFISKEPSDVEKLDSLLSFIKTQASAKTIPYGNITSVSSTLQDTLDLVFGKREEDTAYLPLGQNGNPVWWAALMALIIIPVLIFAGWRMHAERSLIRLGPNEKEKM